MISDGKIVSCMSFRRPFRQTSHHNYELARMTSVSDVKVHGTRSVLMSRFVKDESPSSIVTYSDDRLFSGNVYGKIRDGCVKLDYYWMLGNKRFHKSSLRKAKSSETEAQLRMSQGFRKIWDMGKTRWVWER